MQLRREPFRDRVSGAAPRARAAGRKAGSMRQKAPEAAWSIGATAGHFNISPRAIRFYEEQGLLKLGRNGTHRTLGPQDRAALEQLLLFRRMGFTVAEIRGLRNGMQDGQDALAFPAAEILRDHLQAADHKPRRTRRGHRARARRR